MFCILFLPWALGSSAPACFCICVICLLTFRPMIECSETDRQADKLSTCWSITPVRRIVSDKKWRQPHPNEDGATLKNEDDITQKMKTTTLKNEDDITKKKKRKSPNKKWSQPPKMKKSSPKMKTTLPNKWRQPRQKLHASVPGPGC